MMEEIRIKTNKKYEMIDITKQIETKVKKIKEGTVTIYTQHATGAIIINENYDPNVCEDILNALNKLIPEGIWKHDRIDNNGAAHIKSAILGPSETIPVKNGKLQLGTWQACQFVELDGPKSARKIIITNP